MTRCNKCGSRMIPDGSAIVPALGCTNLECRRVIPLTAVRGAKVDKAAVNRAIRAARRMQARRGK